MFPVYRGMNSYPYPSNQLPSTQYYHPSWEAVPPQMKEDQPSSSYMHESLPHNYGHPAPLPYHSCCTHGQHPAYYSSRPPCSHFPPPPPPTYNHFCGGYPPYPQSYPMYYAPPPHYSMDLPRCEYDKSVPKDQFHCCGCSNHPHHMKGHNNVKIEEQEPDVETKKGESLLPAAASNFQCPIMWIPPEYMMHKDHPRRLVENESNGQQVLPYMKKPQVQRSLIDTEAQDNVGSSSGRKPGHSHQNERLAKQYPKFNKGWFPLDMNTIRQLMDGGDIMQIRDQENKNRDENEGSPSGRKPHQSVRSVDQDPNVRNGWFPLDMNLLKQSMEGGDAMQSRNQENRSRDEKKAPDVENKNQSKQFSYPFIWIPYDGQMEDHLKGQEDKSSVGTTVEKSPAVKVAPRKLEHTDSEAEKGRTTTGDDNSRTGTLGADRKSSVRTIPVKQLEDSVPKLSKKDDEHKVDKATVSKSSQDSAKNCTSKQSSSPTKKSKLPPICLRVDPPKKKSVNGSSRSPSPPGDKKQQKLDKFCSGEKSEQPNKEIKVMNVEEKIPCQNKIEVSHGSGEAKEGSETMNDKVDRAEKMMMQQAVNDETEYAERRYDRMQAQEPLAAKEGESYQVSKRERKVKSDVEAAVLIQSAYRGYSVRRWEPLKKLKEIAKVHEEAILVKKHIEDLESYSTIEDKEKAAIGETIMNLLLKLDTIQGLHETIRDVRRSVAKELIILQEKLDSILSQKAILQSQDTSAAQAAVESPKDSGFVEGSEGVFISAGEPSESSSLDREKGAKASEGEGISSIDLSSSQPPCQDGMDGSRYENTVEKLLVHMDSERGPQDDIMVSDGDVAAAILGSDMINQEPAASEAVQRHSPTEFQESLVNANSVEETVMQDDMVPGNRDQEENPLSELPLEAVEESLATMGPVEDTAAQNDLASGIKGQEENHLLEQAQEVNEESLANVNIVGDTSLENGVVTGNENQEADILSELPIEVVEEDEKEIPLAEHVLDASQAAYPSEDSKDLTEVETPGNLNSHLEVDQPSERVQAGNEDIVVKDHENHEVLKISSKETVSGQEAPSVVSPTNIEMPVMGEVDSKLQEESTCEGASAVEPVQIERVVDFLPPKENEDGVKVDSSEVSNVECYSSTKSFMDPFDNNKDASELLAGDQENNSEIVKPELLEPDVQQSNEKDETVGESLDDQSSVVEGKKDEQIDKIMIEENEKLRQMLEKLLAAGKEQQEVISNLNGKVQDLEKKLAKKNIKSAKHPRVRVSRPSGRKLANGTPRERPMGTAS